SSAGIKVAARGVDRARALLGCLQPGQAASLYGDALNRLADRLHYLNLSGDKAQDTTRFWFYTRANLRREMQDRKEPLDERAEVYVKIAELVSRLGAGKALFDGVHVFAPPADVPDDGALRLVIVAPDRPYAKQDPSGVTDTVLDYLSHHGGKPRFRANRL